MIVSVHIADLSPRGALRLLLRPPRPEAVPGLEYVETTITAPLGGGLPRPGRVAMFAGWEEDEALGRWLASSDPRAADLRQGWHTRLQPLRIFGAWAGFEQLIEGEQPHEQDEPAAVLTLGRLRLGGVVRFLRTAAPAEREAVADPALLAAIGLARPPRLVSTFSLWRSVAEMRDYATRAGGHSAALRADRQQPFHHESAFIRFRPYASEGSWAGSDPLSRSSSRSASS